MRGSHWASLAQPLHRQGKSTAAKSLLEPDLKQMASGRELADKVDAVAQLAELA